MKMVRFENGKRLEYKKASGSSDIDAHFKTLDNIANKYEGRKDLILADLRDVVPTEFKLGYGGSHIWCANKKNERIFIIEGY